MSHKILLIGNTSSRSVVRLKEEAVSLGIILDTIKPSNISLRGDELVVQDTEISFAPLEYDVYFFRGIGRSEARVQQIAKFLNEKNKRVVEKILTVSTLPEDKRVADSRTGTYLLPDQVTMPAEHVSIETITEFPIVIKKASSSMGKGVAKISSVSDLLTFTDGIEGEVFIQKYYPIEFDIRILIVGNKVIGGLARYKPEGEDFLTTRRGGRRESVVLTKDMKDAALEAKMLQGLEIAGVDLFIYENKPYILEVNASPQIFIFETVTGKNAAVEILRYLISSN